MSVHDAPFVHVADTADTHLVSVRLALERLDVASLHRIARHLHDAHCLGRTTYTLGNGGSAALATHFAADISRLTSLGSGGRAFRAVSLTANLSMLTACANDAGFEEVFVEQLRGLVGPGDVVVGLSTSGASPNVINAVRHAKAAGAVTIGLTGREGERLTANVDEALVVDSTNVQVIEDTMLVALHSLCLLTRERRIASGD